MKAKTKSFKELLVDYRVDADYSRIESNLVYPLDNYKEYIVIGTANHDDVVEFCKRVHNNVENVDPFSNTPKSGIANKYAIPFMQTGSLNRLTTMFYYQHDDRTMIISKTIETNDYFG